MAYVWHRAPCCKAIREQKHLKNLLELELEEDFKVVKISLSLPLTSGQNCTITFNLPIIKSYNNTVLTKSGVYSITFGAAVPSNPDLIFLNRSDNENHLIDLYMVYDNLGFSSKTFYNVEFSEDEYLITLTAVNSDINPGYYLTSINIKKTPEFIIYPDLPWDFNSIDYASIYDGYPPTFKEFSNFMDLVMLKKIVFYMEGIQLYPLQSNEFVYFYNHPVETWEDVGLDENYSCYSLIYESSTEYSGSINMYGQGVIDRIEINI